MDAWVGVGNGPAIMWHSVPRDAVLVFEEPDEEELAAAADAEFSSWFD